MSTDTGDVPVPLLCCRQQEQRQPPTPLPAGSGGLSAEQLGIPPVYDPRHRVNVSVVPEHAALKAGRHELQRRLRKLAASPHQQGPLPTEDEVMQGNRRAAVWYEGGAKRGSAAGQPKRASRLPPPHATPPIPSASVASSQVLEEYRTLIAWFEDFHQRRQQGRLRQMAADRAALPIAAYRDAIVAAVRQHPAVVIAGDTGCGKSTQVPQYLVAAGFSRVACTQPRRISAVSLARRVAHETLNAYGDGVGYQVRFSSTVGAATRVVFMTEGILLRMLGGDPLLRSIDVIILDEVR